MNSHPQFDMFTPHQPSERARTITFSCSHVEIIGGNMADPMAIYKYAAGLMDYETNAGLCTRCEFPERFPHQPTSDGWED